MMPHCACPQIPLSPAWRELADSYDVVSNTDNNTAQCFPHNTLSIRALAFACGRLTCATSSPPPLLIPHPPAEAARCHALATSAAAALAAFPVHRGDESDHVWLPLCFPATGASPPAPAEPLLTDSELHAAFNGALWPALRFSARSVAEEAAAVEGEEEGGVEKAAAWRAAAALLVEGGVRRLTSFRPLESGGGPAVWPHFTCGLTEAGSLVGVWGATVWT